MEYIPDNWVIIKIRGNDPHYRVLAGWSGGYAQGDSWKMSSGVVGVEESEHHFYFKNHSGSVYKCSKESYCLRMNNAYIWNKLQDTHGDNVHMMEEDTEWSSLDWIIS